MNSKVKQQLRLTSSVYNPKESTNLKIVYCRIDTLKPDPANPRRHTKRQIRQIADSIKTFGFNVPILIYRDGNVVAGHGRLLACRLLGITEVPTLCLDHLTAAQARVFMIADNRLTEIAAWDDQLLAQQLKELSLSGLDFNIEVTGFEMGEIDLRIASLDDPIDGHASGLGAIHHRPFPMASGEMDRSGFTAFLTEACQNLAAFSGAGSIHFICMDWRHAEELLAAGRGVYGELKNLCVWVKDNG